MKNSVVARNYAEALLELGRRGDQVERFGELLEIVAGVVSVTPAVAAVLMSPRVRKDAKRALLAKALAGLAPDPFIRFLGAVVQRGRQGLLPEISAAYQDLADRHFHRVHASVTTAHEVDAALAQAIRERLEHVVGTTVVPHFRTDPAVLGGVVVRVGDRVFDGSIRRKLQLLRRGMLGSGGAGT